MNAVILSFACMPWKASSPRILLSSVRRCCVTGRTPSQGSSAPKAPGTASLKLRTISLALGLSAASAIVQAEYRLAIARGHSFGTLQSTLCNLRQIQPALSLGPCAGQTMAIRHFCIKVRQGGPPGGSTTPRRPHLPTNRLPCQYLP